MHDHGLWPNDLSVVEHSRLDAVTVACADGHNSLNTHDAIAIRHPPPYGVARFAGHEEVRAHDKLPVLPRVGGRRERQLAVVRSIPREVLPAVLAHNAAERVGRQAGFRGALEAEVLDPRAGRLRILVAAHDDLDRVYRLRIEPRLDEPELVRRVTAAAIDRLLQDAVKEHIGLAAVRRLLRPPKDTSAFETQRHAVAALVADA